MNRRKLLSGLSLLTLTAALPTGAQSASPYAFSDSDLLDALDYAAYPVLAPVETAHKAGDLPGAKKAFAAYLRARTNVPWSLSPTITGRSVIEWKPEAARKARDGKITVVSVAHTFPEAQIDWKYSATGGTTGLPANNEWTWQLNRMEWWRDFIAAYRATRDEAWAQLWVAQLRSWVAQCPPPPKVANSVGSAWRTIECGIRASGILADSYAAFLPSPSLSDEDCFSLVRVLAEHGRYLSACHTGGNWLTMEMNGLYSVGCLFPELKEAAAWRDQAAQALYHEQTVQFLPDGAQFELSPGYHNVALDNVLGIYRRARTVHRVEELPADYARRMERAFEYDLYLMTPDRSLPKFNDSWPDNLVKRLGNAAALFPNREDFAWVGSEGTKGKPPTETSRFFPWAGYCAMREGWGRDACLGILDAGPLGNGHYHQDKLNFVAWPYGRELLFDSGGGSYESSPYRQYATDTFGHNCVLVDGKPQRRDVKLASDRVAAAPLDVRWESTATHDFAEGSYREGWGEVSRHTAAQVRRVLFVKATEQTPPFWVVSDRLMPTDNEEHEYQARWNLLSTVVDAGKSMVATADKNQPNLVVVPLLLEGLDVRAASGQKEPELLGWNVRKDLDPQYVPATTVVHTTRGRGERRFLTLLLPLKPGQAVPIKSIVHLPADGPRQVHLENGSVLQIQERDKDGLIAALIPPSGKEGIQIIGGSGRA